MDDKIIDDYFAKINKDSEELRGELCKKPDTDIDEELINNFLYNKPKEKPIEKPIEEPIEEPKEDYMFAVIVNKLNNACIKINKELQILNINDITYEFYNNHLLIFIMDHLKPPKWHTKHTKEIDGRSIYYMITRQYDFYKYKKTKCFITKLPPIYSFDKEHIYTEYSCNEWIELSVEHIKRLKDELII